MQEHHELMAYVQWRAAQQTSTNAVRKERGSLQKHYKDSNWRPRGKDLEKKEATKRSWC